MRKKLNVIIYGAGVAKKNNIKYAEMYWNIVAIADKNEKLWGDDGEYRIISPGDIKNIAYDFIVIMMYRHQEEARKDLLNLGVDFWKIVYGCRFTSDWDIKRYYSDLTMKKRKQLACKCKFENRSNASEKLLYILIGYKDFLWEDVLGRVKEFCPKDIDVCLLSSGLYDERLSEYASKYGWSYLSTDINDVTIAQNYCVSYYKNAKIIYKMDEDVYVTKNSFEKMEKLYNDVRDRGEINIGYVGPMIPLHSSSYIFLKQFNLIDKYKTDFNKSLVYGGDLSSPEIRIDSRYAKWYWSLGSIDQLNVAAETSKGLYELTTLRYGICFILFGKSFFEEMGGFDVDEIDNHGTGWEGDEAQVMKFCRITGKMGIVALDTVCGHFCYPEQEVEMLNFRRANRELFDINKEV